MSLKCSNCGSARLIYEQEGKPKRTRQRMGKHERLLRAIVDVMTIYPNEGRAFVGHTGYIKFSEGQMKQLIAIKQAMEKKGGK